MKIRKNYICPVCREPIQKRGATHYRCQGPDGPSISYMSAALDRVLHELERKAGSEVKWWNRDMGLKRLKEMFPTMVERVQANETR